MYPRLECDGLLVVSFCDALSGSPAPGEGCRWRAPDTGPCGRLTWTRFPVHRGGNHRRPTLIPVIDRGCEYVNRPPSLDSPSSGRRCGVSLRIRMTVRRTPGRPWPHAAQTPRRPLCRCVVRQPSILAGVFDLATHRTSPRACSYEAPGSARQVVAVDASRRGERRPGAPHWMRSSPRTYCCQEKWWRRRAADR